MTNERLDETIDRVAQAMTAVPADPAFSARLTDRMQRRHGDVAPWVLAVSAAAAVLVATLVTLRPVADQPESTAAVARHDALAPDAPVAATAPEPAAATAPAEPAAPVAAAPSAPSAPPAPTGAEDAVPALSVAALTLEPLTLAAVDVSPLDVASLEIADIDSGAETKEPK